MGVPHPNAMRPVGRWVTWVKVCGKSGPCEGVGPGAGLFRGARRRPGCRTRRCPPSAEVVVMVTP
ncbi:hypothetical protein SXIM_10060 [Streptomyces xiamenensis]|uniref:Uncharacterized protein n=1 Tax=Streptomyces xiamenensis TaxID=408015 RepID=A0A0F7FS60_9ACTN|nr:hypothetical protein SXIM_10060 [Streptomyces xiamenensis]